MSFILDALNRSERERQQGQAPNLSDQNMLLHINRHRSSWWPIALVIVLLLNAAIYFGFKYYEYTALNDEAKISSEQSTGQDKSTDEVGSTQTSPEPVSAGPVSRPNPAAVVQEEMQLKSRRPSIEPANTPDRYTPPSQTAAPAEDRSSVAEAKTKEPVAKNQRVTTKQAATEATTESEAPAVIVGSAESESSSGAGRVTVAEEPLAEGADAPVSAPTSRYPDVRQLSEMSRAFQKSIPDITFNSHIYSDRPSARRVMINNIYLREGQEISGMQLLEIGEYNLVFSKGEQLFKLPVMRDWRG